MLKHLELEGLHADLADVSAMLERRTSARDSLARFQLTARKAALERKVNEVAQYVQNAASVALHFGGGPVIGSHGIAAAFSGKILDKYQNLVSLVFSALESQRPLGERGKARNAQSSQLMVTGLARGSFGFILEEGQEQMLVPSVLKNAVEGACDVIYQLAGEDDRGVDEAAESLDARIVGALREFFRTLQDADAEIRVVEGERSYTLHHDDVRRGFVRAASLEVTEDERDIAGELLAIPASLRFELTPSDGNAVIKGTVLPDALQAITGEDGRLKPGLFPGKFVTRVRIKQVQQAHGNTKTKYTLLSANPVVG